MITYNAISFAQENYVTNWSLEDTLHCPTNAAHIYYALHWYSPTPTTPDYYNSCSYYFGVPDNGLAFQYAKDGNAYAGIFCYDTSHYNDRDYIQVMLKDTLIKNKTYCAGFWVSLVEHVQYAVDHIGMFVSKDPVGLSIPSILPYVPQIENPTGSLITDTLNWVLISGSFQAQGGEKYITIGNFRDDSLTGTLVVDPASYKAAISYYLVDAVFLYECDSTKVSEAGDDVTICKGDSINIGFPSFEGCKYKWSPSIGLNNDTISRPLARPLVTTTYYLTMTDPFYQISRDSVTVTINHECLSESAYIPTIFSPNNDDKNDILFVRSEYIKEMTLSIYNRWGEKVFESRDKGVGWDGTYKGKPCMEGVYTYYLVAIFNDGSKTSKKGTVTLMR